MSPEAQRIAIAEACGWRDIREGVNCVTNPQGERVFFNTLETHWEEIVPDYLTDLNAMHEAENVLTAAQQRQFATRLDEGMLSSVHDEESCTDWTGIYNVLHATAAQRAEAFLRTIGKWDDDPPVQREAATKFLS